MSSVRERRPYSPEGPRPRIKEISESEHVTIFELRRMLIETQKKLGIVTPELSDLIEYTGIFKELGEIDAEKAKELRERIASKGIDPKYAAIIASQLPVTADEVAELLPRNVSRDLTPEVLEEIAAKIREILKGRSD